MGRHFSGLDEDLETKDYHAGSIWGIILQFFNYHHRCNSKQTLCYRKRRRLRILRWCTNTKTISMPHGPGEAQMLQKDEAEHVKQNMKTRSRKLFKKERHMHRKLQLYAQSQLQETNSVPHVDGSNNVPSHKKLVSLVHKKSGSAGSKSMNPKPTKILGKPVSGLRELDSQCILTADDNQSSERCNIIQEKFVRMSEISQNDSAITKKLRRAISDKSDQKSLDVMDIFKVNKELVLDIIQDSALGLFPEKHASIANEKFTRSGSFPLPNSFDRRYLRPTTLEHKQYEIWSFIKGDRSLDFLSLKPVAFRTDGTVGRTKSEETRSSSLESHRLAWSVVFRNLFKDVKHIFKYTKRDEKLRSKHTNSDGSPMKIPSKTRPGETNTGQVSISSCSHGHQSDAPDHDHHLELHRVRRTASLNASLDRYAKLFEKSFNGDAKLSQSKSLRMTNEDKLSSRKQTPKFFRRISSLSELESFVSILNEVSRGDPSSEMPVCVVENTTVTTNGEEKNEQTSTKIIIDTRKLEPKAAVLDTKFEGAIVETKSQSLAGFLVHTNGELVDRPVDFKKKLAEPETCGSQHPHGHGNDLDTSRELMEQISDFVHGRTSPDDISSTEQHAILEGLNSNSFKPDVVEADPSLISQEGSNQYSLPDFCSTADCENIEDNRKRNKDFAGADSDRDPNACFNYVRDVLEISGFIGNEELATWHSPSQPLSPSLFQEPGTWTRGEKCDNQLLFDLVNESMLEIYSRSPGYFPRSFSLSSGICQVPKGKKLVEQVWGNLSKKLDYILEQDQSLDDIVSRDFVKDSWMNLQLDAESVVLGLEDMIFDELLDQVLFL